MQEKFIARSKKLQKWIQSWGLLEVEPETKHKWGHREAWYNYSFDCFAKVSVVVFWVLLILKSWVWRVAAILEKTCVKGLILHWAGSEDAPNGENSPAVGNLKERAQQYYQQARASHIYDTHNARLESKIINYILFMVFCWCGSIFIEEKDKKKQDSQVLFRL